MIRAALVLLLVLGCGADPVQVRVRAFEHPEDVAFACFTSAGGVVPLRECANSENDASVALHALVTQGGRGQVGVVDLDANQVIDADRQVPGFTFVPVGEIPSDILVPEENPELTFVADLGSFDVLAVQTSALRSTSAGGADIYLRIPMPAAPTELAISPDESKIFVTLPEAGSVAVIDRASVQLGADPPTPRFLDLSASVPSPVSASPPAADYCRVCSASEADAENAVGCEGLLVDPWPTDDAGNRVATVPRPLQRRSRRPAPSSIVIDEASGNILVGDSNLPLIHVIATTASVEGVDRPRLLEPEGSSTPWRHPPSRPPPTFTPWRRS